MRCLAVLPAALLAGTIGLAVSASATLADPPPEGTEVAFQFSGAQNDNDGTGDEVATAVHCTNRGSDEVNVSLEFFSTDATTAFTTPAFAIPSGETRTLTTQTVPAFFGTDLALDFFSQASGRVLTSAADLICTVQLVDPINNQPRFLASLALHDANGELVTLLPEPTGLVLQLTAIAGLAGCSFHRRRRSQSGS